MDQLNIDRINELYQKSQTVGLTEEEKEEQVRLRKDYIARIRKNLRGTLDKVSFVNPDGSVTKAGDTKKGTLLDFEEAKKDRQEPNKDL